MSYIFYVFTLMQPTQAYADLVVVYLQLQTDVATTFVSGVMFQCPDRFFHWNLTSIAGIELLCF